MKENTFVIHNQHNESCGKFPNIDTTNKYLGYYENVNGGQFIFVGDQEQKKAIIYSGDIGWENSFEIYFEMPHLEIILNENELLWISNCFSSMTGINFNSVYKTFRNL